MLENIVVEVHHIARLAFAERVYPVERQAVVEDYRRGFYSQLVRIVFYGEHTVDQKQHLIVVVNMHVLHFERFAVAVSYVR